MCLKYALWKRKKERHQNNNNSNSATGYFGDLFNMQTVSFQLRKPQCSELRCRCVVSHGVRGEAGLRDRDGREDGRGFGEERRV